MNRHIDSWLECAFPWGEREVKVEYDYQPREPVTREHPGCAEDATITRIYFISGRQERDVTSHATPDDLERLRVECLCAEAEGREHEAERRACALEDRYDAMREDLA